MNERIAKDLGYWTPRMLPTGEWAGLRGFMFTVGLIVGLDEIGYRCRWCYPDALSASAALECWDGQGDPPGPWIKQKGRTVNGEHVDRVNPMRELPVEPIGFIRQRKEMKL